MGKTSWYKQKPNNVKVKQGTRGAGKGRPQGAQLDRPLRRPSAVLFVKRTRGGKLIDTLRKQE